MSGLELIRTWEDPDSNGFLLQLYSVGRHDHYGKSILSYQFFHNWEKIFEGDDFHNSPSHADDSDEAVRSLLMFLSLKPGDTDREYFDSYTPRQMEWCQQWGDALAHYTMEEGE